VAGPRPEPMVTVMHEPDERAMEAARKDPGSAPTRKRQERTGADTIIRVK